MTQNTFALHETMDVHELLTMKTVCLTKSTTLQVLVTDPQLRTLLQTSAATDRQHIQDLQSMLSDARIMTEYQGGVQS